MPFAQNAQLFHKTAGLYIRNTTSWTRGPSTRSTQSEFAIQIG